MARLAKAQVAQVLSDVAEKIVPYWMDAYRAATVGVGGREHGYTQTTACLPNNTADGKYIPSLESFVSEQLTEAERAHFGHDMAAVITQALQGSQVYYVKPTTWTFQNGQRAGATVNTVVVGKASNTANGFARVSLR